MSARGEIENTLYRYAWAYDMDELDLIGDCFTADAEVGFSTGVQVGREAVVDELKRRHGNYRPVGTIPWHVISNVLIRSETDDHAHVISFYTLFLKEPGSTPTVQNIGHYDDVLVEDGGRWRIRRRTVVAAGE